METLSTESPSALKSRLRASAERRRRTLTHPSLASYHARGGANGPPQQPFWVHQDLYTPPPERPGRLFLDDGLWTYSAPMTPLEPMKPFQPVYPLHPVYTRHFNERVEPLAGGGAARRHNSAQSHSYNEANNARREMGGRTARARR